MSGRIKMEEPMQIFVYHALPGCSG
jgi:hypothetical protein